LHQTTFSVLSKGSNSMTQTGQSPSMGLRKLPVSVDAGASALSEDEDWGVEGALEKIWESSVVRNASW